MIEIMLIESPADIALLEPLLREWHGLSLAEADRFDLPGDPDFVRDHTLPSLAAGRRSCVIAAVLGDRPVGFMGLAWTPSHIGPGRIARECLFFVSPSHRGRAGKALLDASREVALAWGCTHRILTVSRRAAATADRAARWLEHNGLVEYERTYLEVLR